MTTLAEYELKLKGYHFRQRTAWEVARWEQYHQTQISPNIKPERKPRSPKALLKFDWEEDDEIAVTAEECHITEEGQNALTELMKKTFNL